MLLEINAINAKQIIMASTVVEAASLAIALRSIQLGNNAVIMVLASVSQVLVVIPAQNAYLGIIISQSQVCM